MHQQGVAGADAQGTSVWYAVPTGMPSAAPSTGVTWGGRIQALAAETTTSVAYAPETPLKTTGSPTRNPSTPAPTAVTTPAASEPTDAAR